MDHTGAFAGRRATTEAATEIETLRAELAELRREFATMKAAATAHPSVATTGPSITRSRSAGAPPASGRRGFLRLAGAAAVGATAVAVTGTSQPAAAASGQPVVLGVDTNQADPGVATVIRSASPTNLDRATVVVRNRSVGDLPLPDNHRIAIAAVTNGADATPGLRTGVYARAAGPAAAPDTGGGQGVFGSAGGDDNTYNGSQIGVFGTAGQGGYGIAGLSNAGALSVGVLGRADEGYGLVGSSDTGISILARNGGRIQQQLRSTVGAPTIGTFNKGEMVRDLSGDLYLCVATGAPGTWQKVTAQHPAYANAGGSINLLPRPIRLIDSRGNGAPLTNGAKRFAPGVALEAQITGTVADGLSVPAGAKGILGNLTATEPLANGFALVWATGQAQPMTSNINYSTSTATPAIANYFISSISAAGKMNVMAAAASTHLIVDVFGFVY